MSTHVWEGKVLSDRSLRLVRNALILADQFTIEGRGKENLAEACLVFAVKMEERARQTDSRFKIEKIVRENAQRNSRTYFKKLVFWEECVHFFLHSLRECPESRCILHQALTREAFGVEEHNPKEFPPWQVLVDKFQDDEKEILFGLALVLGQTE